jgi:hypothetical protein
MADIATRLRTFLLGSDAITSIVGQRVHQSHVPHLDPDKPVPAYIWFGRTTTRDERQLAGAAGEAEFSTMFSLECFSEDLDEAQRLGAAVKSRLNNYQGAFGDSTVQGIFVEDQNDDYIPRSIPADVGAELTAFSVEVIP